MRRNFLSRFRFDSRYHLDAINFPSITIFRKWTATTKTKKRGKQYIYEWASQCPMSSLSRILWEQKYVFCERYNESLNMHTDDVNKIYCHSALIEISLKALVCCVRKSERRIYRCVKVAYEFCKFTIEHTHEKYYEWIFHLTKYSQSLIVYYACDIKRGDLFAWRNPYRSSLCHLLTSSTLNE